MANKCKHCGKGNILQSTLRDRSCQDFPNAFTNPYVKFEPIKSLHPLAMAQVENLRKIMEPIIDELGSSSIYGPSNENEKQIRASKSSFRKNNPLWKKLAKFVYDEWPDAVSRSNKKGVTRDLQMTVCADCGEVNRLFVEPFTGVVENLDSNIEKLPEMEKIASELPTLLEEHIQEYIEEEEKRQKEIAKLEDKISKLKDK